QGHFLTKAPRAHPPRGPEGPSPGHVARPHSNEGALAASPQAHVEAPRDLAAARTSADNVSEVARVLLLALGTSAGAPTPSGCPALRSVGQRLLTPSAPRPRRTRGGPSAAVAQPLLLLP